jgi:uncharacterized protein with gpF-like domain
MTDDRFSPPSDAAKDFVIGKLNAEIGRLMKALQIADDSIRHHLRGDSIAAAMIQPHAVQAIRDALKPVR